MTLFVAYITVAVIAAVIVFVASAQLVDEGRPVGHRVGLSMAAGAVWPVILIGLAEFSSFAMYAKVHEHDEDPERVLVKA